MIDWTTFQLFEPLWEAISAEHTIRSSPLRTPTVATVGPTVPHIRTMVLRELNPYHLVFFTDRRSQKCTDIALNPHTSVHCYFPSSKQQIQLYGTMSMSIIEPTSNMKRMMTSALRRPQDYATFDPPGIEVSTLESIHYDHSLAEQNFGLLVFDVTEIHLLTLGNPHHRCTWQRNMENNLWSKQWLVP